MWVCAPQQLSLRHCVCLCKNGQDPGQRERAVGWPSPPHRGSLRGTSPGLREGRGWWRAGEGSWLLSEPEKMGCGLLPHSWTTETRRSSLRWRER